MGRIPYIHISNIVNNEDQSKIHKEFNEDVIKTNTLNVNMNLNIINNSSNAGNGFDSQP